MVIVKVFEKNLCVLAKGGGSIKLNLELLAASSAWVSR